jgi:F-type H+-transporting ATPase subunit b
MELIPTDIGPLNPHVPEMAVALVLFAGCYLVLARLLRRMNRVLETREQATDGVERQAAQVRAEAEAVREAVLTLLADARHDAARIRQQAREEGAALIAGARAEALRECEALLAESAARIEADRAAAEEQLRSHVPALARELASRMLGEPVPPASRPTAAESR